MSWNWNSIYQVKDNGTPILTNKLEDMVFVDLKQIVSQHGARILGGQGISFASEDENLTEFFNKFKTFNKLDDLFVNMVEIANYWGSVFPVVDKLKGGDWSITICQPQIFQSVATMDIQKISATYYKQYGTGTGMYFERTRITKDKIYKIVSTKEIPDGSGLTKIPTNLQSIIKDTEAKNPYGFIPIYKFLNKPNRTMYSQYYIINADDFAVRHIPSIINHIYRQLWKEVIFNKTRIFGSFSQAQQNKLISGNSELSTYTSDFLTLTEDSGEATQKVDILQGDPKIDNYMNGITRLTDEYIKGCLYSPQNDSEVQQTQAETLFTKSKDIETTKYKRERYTELLYDILDDIFTYEGFMEKGTKDRPYSISINENIVYNEIQLTNLLAQAIDNDLMSHTEAIAKLRGVEPDSANEIFKKILKENMKYFEEVGNTKPLETPKEEVRSAEKPISGGL